MPLQVGIIGAGIAGLGAAIALRRAGHDVEVFEQSHFKNEVGAAITITPNGTRVLDHWGFDHEKARAVKSQQIRFVDGRTLAPMPKDSLAGCTERYGYPLNHYHRVDLHKTLTELAQSPSLPDSEAAGNPVVIRLGAKVVHIDPLEATMVLEDGLRIQKDLLVIADGINSSFIADVTGKNEPTLKTGRSAFRCLIPFDDIMADEETREFFENEPPGFWLPTILATKTICVTYPCRGGEILNIAVVHYTREGHQDSDDWHSPASLQDLLDVTKDFHPVVHKIFRKAPEVKIYNLTHRHPLSRLSRGKTVLIGDAAHPMLPTHVQGATLSLTEAAALEVFFTNNVDCTSIPSLLTLYNTILRPRAAVTQLMSNQVWYKPDDLKARLAQYYDGPVPDMTALSFSEGYREFFYGWDVRGLTEQALKEWEGANNGFVSGEGVNGEGAKGKATREGSLKDKQLNGEEKKAGDLVGVDT